MSMLSTQVDNLRLTADVISERGVTSGDLAIIEIRLREAADTIEGLRDRLQEVQGVTSESNYTRLFGTPERAARALLDMCKCAEFCDYCPLYGQGVEHCEFPDANGSVLEWLKGVME